MTRRTKQSTHRVSRERSRRPPRVLCLTLTHGVLERSQTVQKRAGHGRRQGTKRHEEEKRRGEEGGMRQKEGIIACGDPKEREEVTPRDCLSVKANCKARHCR